MAFGNNPYGQALYRSLSQRQNPFTDQPQATPAPPSWGVIAPPTTPVPSRTGVKPPKDLPLPPSRGGLESRIGPEGGFAGRRVFEPQLTPPPALIPPTSPDADEPFEPPTAQPGAAPATTLLNPPQVPQAAYQSALSGALQSTPRPRPREDVPGIPPPPLPPPVIPPVTPPPVTPPPEVPPPVTPPPPTPATSPTTPLTIATQDPIEFLQTVQRRTPSGGPGVAMGAAGGAGLGAQVGSIVPGIGTAIGAGIGAVAGGIYGAINKQAATAGTDFSLADAAKSIELAYQSWLGRAASPAEVRAQLQGQGWKPGVNWVGAAGLAAVLNSIKQSPEAQTFATKPPTTVTPPVPDTTTPPPAPAPTPTPPPVTPPVSPSPTPSPSSYSHQLEGFDKTKLADLTHKSPKYVFARIAAGFDVTNVAGRQAMLAALKADPSGYFKNATLSGSKGDILEIGTGADAKFNGITKFDIIKAAGEGGKAWTWQPITSSTVAPPPSPNPSNPPPGAAGPPGSAWTPQGPNTTYNSSMLGSNLVNDLLSKSIQGQINFKGGANNTYSKQMLDYLMRQLALGGALR